MTPNRKNLMHGPPPTPEEIQARLWRHVRHAGRAGATYRETALGAADDLELSAQEVFDLLGGSDF